MSATVALDLDEEARQLFDDDSVAINHYMRKAAIMAGIVNGTAGRALCGLRFGAEDFEGGEVSSRFAAICDDCNRIYNTLRADAAPSPRSVG